MIAVLHHVGSISAFIMTITSLQTENDIGLNVRSLWLDYLWKYRLPQVKRWYSWVDMIRKGCLVTSQEQSLPTNYCHEDLFEVVSHVQRTWHSPYITHSFTSRTKSMLGVRKDTRANKRTFMSQNLYSCSRVTRFPFLYTGVYFWDSENRIEQLDIKITNIEV